ncbi:MAG: chemotaxis protein CheX [Spirochaetia bacterium]|nr:chemotaxis protein CheX [Spirochaetia bacterium]
MNNPELDQRFILTISSSFIEIITEWLNVTAISEGYGQTSNEGLCYEFCSGIPFTGTISGEMFIGMDGFTRLLLLPYIITHLDMEFTHSQLVEAAMNSLVLKIAKEFSEELDAISHIKMLEPRNLNHKLVPLAKEDYRKYMMIYFIRDDENKKYLGRIYLHLVLDKK